MERIGLKVEQNRRRHRPHLPAAGRPQRARPHPLQLPEQVPGVPARHAGQAPVRPRQARLQPRLHARAGPAEVRRGAAVAGAAERALHRRTPAEDVRRLGDQHQLPDTSCRCTSTYQTAFVDDDGKLAIRDDVYGRDAAHAAAAQGLRAQDRRYRDRPAEGLVVGAGADAARHVRRRQLASSAAADRSSSGCSARPSPGRQGRARVLAAPTIADTSSAKRRGRSHHSIAPCTARGDFFWGSHIPTAFASLSAMPH